MKDIDWKEIRAVSWDIDGTLYDLHAFMSLLKQDLIRRALTLRWWSLCVDVFRLVRFKLHMDQVRRNPPDYPVGTLAGRDDIAETMGRLYAHILPQIGTLPGVVALLDWIQLNGKIQVVFSDYRQSTKLTALNLSSYFSNVFAGEDLGNLKPSPHPFVEIIEQLRIRPHQLLHIGDRVDTDGAAAEEVGFQTAIIGADFSSADELLKHLSGQEDSL